MISERISTILNEQVNKEFYSAYLYLSMDAYFRQIGLLGFANWCEIQAKEEVDHAMIIFDFIIDYEGRIQLMHVNAPDLAFKSPTEVMKLAAIHERRMSDSIDNIKTVATEENDQPTSLFMDWYIKEQFEEEYHLRNIEDQLKFCTDNKVALILLDKELKEREYEKTTYRFV